MPEGDSVWLAARRLHGGLAGRRIARSDFRVPQHATADLRGATVREVVPRGKHLLTRLDSGLTLHTHFSMEGSWTLLGRGRRLPRHLAGDVRVVLETDGPTAVGLRLPVVDLLPTDREHDVVGHLGPDLLGPDWDEDEAVRRLGADPDRPVVAALLDQRNLAGIGNLWAIETLYLRGVWPFAPVATVELRPAVRLARRMMTFSLTHPGQVTTGDTRRGRTHWVYGRSGEPCLRCGTPVAFASGDTGSAAPYARETWWCPTCQPAPVRARA